MIIESNIRALVLLNLLNELRKRDKMLDKMLGLLSILSLFHNKLNKFNKTWALMYDPLYSVVLSKIFPELGDNMFNNPAKMQVIVVFSVIILNCKFSQVK